MAPTSDSDSGLGQFVPGLDGDNERRLRYQEKLKDAQDLRNQRIRMGKSDGPIDIFDFGNRQKERRIAIDISSDDEVEEKRPERKSPLDSKKRGRRKFSKNEALSDSSDSDVVEISAFKRTGRAKARKPMDPLLKKIDLNQMCSEHNIRQAQNQNLELRQSMVIVAETSKLIQEIRAPIQVDQNIPLSPTKTPEAQKLPDLVAMDKVLRDGQNSDVRMRVCFRILDSDSNLFTNTHMFVDDEFSDLYKKVSQYYGQIWLTINGFEIDQKATPIQLQLQDGETLIIAIAKPSKGFYTPTEAGIQTSDDVAGSITLRFCPSGKQEISLKVMCEDTFAKIRQRLCNENGFSKVVFLMDGDRVDEYETVSGMDLEDGDQVDINVS